MFIPGSNTIAESDASYSNTTLRSSKVTRWLRQPRVLETYLTTEPHLVASTLTKKACAAAANILGVEPPNPDTNEVPDSLSEGMHIIKSIWQARVT